MKLFTSKIYGLKDNQLTEYEVFIAKSFTKEFLVGLGTAIVSIGYLVYIVTIML